MKKLMISLSVAVFALAMMANIQYALDGYGVDNSNLHAQVLAQSTGTGGTTDGGGSTTGGSFFCSTYTLDVYTELAWSYEINAYYVSLIHKTYECNNGFLSWCYPGYKQYYYDEAGKLEKSIDNTYMSGCL